MIPSGLEDIAGSANWRRVEPRTIAAVTDPVSFISGKLVQSPSFADFLTRAGGERPVLLTVNDADRDTDSPTALRGIAAALVELNVDRSFDVLFAAGSHRASVEQRASFENRTLAGCPLSIREIHWHDCDDAAQLRPLGSWRIHRCVAEAAGVLSIGSVEPHYFAGMTGAHKTMTIGCLDRASIQANHAGAMSPASAPFSLAGNPVYDGIVPMVETLRARCATFTVNLVMRGGAVVDAAAGDWRATLEALAPVVRQMYAYEIDRPVDLAVLTARGALARTFYQADKAIKNNEEAVRDGGAIILDAPCEDGIGPDHFMKFLAQAPTHAAAEAEIARRGYRLGEHKAVRLRHLTDPLRRGVRLAVVSRHLTDEQVRPSGGRRFADVAAAFRWATGEIGGAREALHVEDAANVAINRTR